MNEIVLNFCIWDCDDILPNGITDLLGIQPTKIHIKGEKKYKNSSSVSKENGWILTSNCDNHSSFEIHLNALLDVLERKRGILEQISKKYNCEFSCAVFINNSEESTPWIHLGKRYNEFVRSINIEFDFDLYCNSQECDNHN